jgi:hypothetical protein
VRVEPRSNNAIAAGLSSFAGTKHHQSLDLARHPEKSKPTDNKLRAKDRPLANDFVSDEEFDRLLHAWFGNMARVLEPDAGSTSGAVIPISATIRRCSRLAGCTSAKGSSGTSSIPC